MGKNNKIYTTKHYSINEILPIAFTLHKYYKYRGVTMGKPTTRDLFNIVTHENNTSKIYQKFAQRVLLESSYVDSEKLFNYIFDRSSKKNSDWAKTTHKTLSENKIYQKDINYILSSITFINNKTNFNDFIQEGLEKKYFSNDTINYEVGRVVRNVKDLSSLTSAFSGDELLIIRTFSNNIYKS